MPLGLRKYIYKILGNHLIKKFFFRKKTILTLMILDMISILKVSSVYAMIPPGIEVELEPELTGTVTVKLNESVDGLPLA